MLVAPSGLGRFIGRLGRLNDLPLAANWPVLESSEMTSVRSQVSQYLGQFRSRARSLRPGGYTRLPDPIAASPRAAQPDNSVAHPFSAAPDDVLDDADNGMVLKGIYRGSASNRSTSPSPNIDLVPSGPVMTKYVSSYGGDTVIV